MSLKSYSRLLPYFSLLKLKNIFTIYFWKRWRNKPHHNLTSWRQSLLKFQSVSELTSLCLSLLPIPLLFSLPPSFSLWTSRVESWVIYTSHSWHIIHMCMSLALLLFYFIIFLLHPVFLFPVSPPTTGSHSKMLYSCFCMCHWRI